MVDMIRNLVANPCRDACGTVATGELLDGAPVFRCPGCDSTWVEVDDTPSTAEDANPVQLPDAP